VPQGSVLSVTLFAVAINRMVNAVWPSVAAFLYVDDIAIYYSSQSIVTIKHWLQGAVNWLSQWALENGFSFSPDETQCVHFTCLKGLHPHPSLSLSNIALPFVLMVKFLGLILDSKISWGPDMRCLCIKCERLLSVLSGCSWGRDRMVMLHLYCSLIRSKIDCGSFVRLCHKVQTIK
jgi:hypothetical protein